MEYVLQVGMMTFYNLEEAYLIEMMIIWWYVLTCPFNMLYDTCFVFSLWLVFQIIYFDSTIFPTYDIIAYACGCLDP